jgi:TonB family protein
VFTAFYRAWTPPDDVINTASDVVVRVVIGRDGSILSSTISKRSGTSSLDRSVERALQRAKLPPFPKESSDSERTYDIIFDLQARNSIG